MRKDISGGSRLDPVIHVLLPNGCDRGETDLSKAKAASGCLLTYKARLPFTPLWIAQGIEQMAGYPLFALTRATTRLPFDKNVLHNVPGNHRVPTCHCSLHK